MLNGTALSGKHFSVEVLSALWMCWGTLAEGNLSECSTQPACADSVDSSSCVASVSFGRIKREKRLHAWFISSTN